MVQSRREWEGGKGSSSGNHRPPTAQSDTRLPGSSGLRTTQSASAGQSRSPPERSRDPHSPPGAHQFRPGEVSGNTGSARARSAREQLRSRLTYQKPGIGRIERGGRGDVRSRTKGRDGASARTSPLLHPCQPSLALGASAHLLPH
jgi:hypothetical protein